MDTSLPFATGDLTIRACSILGRIISETKQFSSTPYIILSFEALFQTARRCQGAVYSLFFAQRRRGAKNAKRRYRRAASSIIFLVFFL